MAKKSRLQRPVLEIPSDIKDLLVKNELYDCYLNRPAYQQNDYIGWILRAKKEETRQKRVNQMMDELKNGNVYMNMAYKQKSKNGGSIKMTASRADLIDAYIAQFPEGTKEKLTELRSIIGEIAPEAEERMSYNMPSFYQNGTLVYYAAFKNHIGFYPTSSGITHFEDALKPYKYSKGAIQFKIEEELPASLIQRIVEFRIKENQLK